MTPPPSPVSTLWSRWKSLKLPWRRRWLAGSDLSQNTYWYFQPTRTSPPRRILQSFNPGISYSDIRIPPQWHQWLRYTRSSPPSIAEQERDVVRQVELKKLARAADERWEAAGVLGTVAGKEKRGSVLGAPDGVLEEGRRERISGEEKEGEGGAGWKGKMKGEDNAGRRPGERWQPEGWRGGPG